MRRGFDIAHELPKSLVDAALAPLGIDFAPKDIPAPWRAIVGAADPRPAIRALFACELGDKIADAVTHVGLHEGRLAYVFLGLAERRLRARVLYGTLPIADPRADRWPDVARLLAVHGSLLDGDGHGVFAPNDWWENAGGELDVGDDDGLPAGYRVPHELIRIARPFSAFDDDPDAALGWDPISEKAYAIMNGGLEGAPDVVSDLERHVEILVGGWDNHYAVPHTRGPLPTAFQTAKKADRTLQKLDAGTVLVGKLDAEFVALLKTRSAEYAGFIAGSEEAALEGLSSCPSFLNENDATELFSGVKKMKRGAATLLPGAAPPVAWADKDLPDGDVALLAKGGVVPRGTYTLSSSVVWTGSASGNGEVVVVAPPDGPAIIFEGDGELRGFVVETTATTAIHVKKGRVTIEECRLSCASTEKDRNGVHVTGDAMVVVRRCHTRGFHSGIGAKDSATLEVTDCLLEAGENGIGIEGESRCKAERVHASLNLQGGFVANERSRIEVRSSTAYRPKLVGFYADGTASLLAEDCAAIASGMAGFYAGGGGVLELDRVTTAHSRDAGVKAADTSKIHVKRWHGHRDRWGAMSRTSATMKIEASEVEAPHENAVYASGDGAASSPTLSCHGVTVRRATWPAFAATGKGALTLDACKVDCSTVGALVRGEGSRIDALNTTFLRCRRGVEAHVQGELTLTDCAFVLMPDTGILVAEGGVVRETNLRWDRCSGARHHGKDESDVEVVTPPDPVDARPREPLGDVVSPTGILALLDFSTIAEWDAEEQRSLATKEAKNTFGFEHPGGFALVIAVPAGKSLPIFGTRMAEEPFPSLWRTVDLEIAPELAVHKREILGHLIVDGARFMFADIDALAQWNEGKSLDGKADAVFWGRDDEAVAKATGAGHVGTSWGWGDFSLKEAKKKMKDVGRAVKDQDWLVVGEVRPHDHHYRLLESIVADMAGTIAIGDARLCGMFTSWGDGVFPVWRELSEDDRLVRLRVQLGTDVTVRNMKAVNGMD